MGKTFTSKVKHDKRRKCIKCGNEFNLSIREQDFFEEKGLQLPKRCKVCRGIHKRDMELLGIDKRGKYYGLGNLSPGL